MRDCGANPALAAAVDSGETDRGGVGGGGWFVVGNAGGGKPGSHGSKAILLSQAYGVESSLWPLSPHIPTWTAEE